ncbi:LysR family transcriptional regulator [Pokkaliibacter plantistimulans]|uniref:LysR family transcriptional regulator n=1 Tax=Proteobacteria bacterium 228 TaxID=2083153 RepID=A0A2S5KRB3_9PROT|nr:LysR family transcriptional regulator [Pokkaliibacter plantistimulans]PPC77243.1 LysR family transcriptional regulator [Pokkaliibacter plantistimulans]
MGNTFDTQALQAFITVAECQSFSLAAHRLFLTQPAVSKRIAALEEQVGHRLFDRVGRQIQLTQAGQLLLKRSYALFDMMEDTRRDLDNLSGEVSGPLTLATSHHIGLHRLPPYLRHYSRSHPKVKLDIHFGESEKAYEGVLQGYLEMAVITLAPDPDPRLESVLLWQDDLCFAVSPEHPLALLPEPTLGDLETYAAILPDQSTFTRQRVENILQSNGVKLNLGVNTNNLDTIQMMVEIGQGWSLLPRNLTQSLTVLPLLDTKIERPLGYIRHKERTLSNAAQAMMHLLAAPLPKA